MTRELAAIDAILEAAKELVGVPQWQEEGAVATLSVTVSLDGTVVGGFRLTASTPVRIADQRGDATLILDGRPLARLAFNPKNAHVNPSRHPVPAALRRLTLPAGRSRIYLWQDNRWWPRERGDVLAARLIEPQPESLVDAIAGFLSDNAISGTLVAPPWRPELSL